MHARSPPAVTDPVTADLAATATADTAGLSSAEAALRLARYGPNAVTEERLHPAWQVLRHFRSQAADRLGAVASLLPYRTNREVASCEASPSFELASSANNSAVGCCQKSLLVIGRIPRATCRFTTGSDYRCNGAEAALRWVKPSVLREGCNVERIPASWPRTASPGSPLPALKTTGRSK
jgi:hypothetical protein